MLSVCGSRLLILDIATMSQRFFPSVSGRGVGCVAVHPNRSVFAVGEKGVQPFIVVSVVPFPQCIFVTRCSKVHVARLPAPQNPARRHRARVQRHGVQP